MISFDTRNTKPKLTALWILTAIAALLLCGLFFSGKTHHPTGMAFVMAGYALGVILVLLWAFREQIHYNPYSYNTILYLGFALFSLFVLLTYLYLGILMIRDSSYTREWQILSELMSSARNYMLFTSPFLLGFSFALCLSNLFLIRHEGKHLVNLLGILLSLLLIGGEVFIFTFNFYVSGSQFEVMMHDMLSNLFASIFLYLECMLFGTIVADAIAAKHEPEKDKAFLIVLGCKLRSDGTPPPLLAGRLDRALAFYENQKTKTGMGPTFITSGGQGKDEVISESESMKRYLLAHGIPEDKILTEDQSTNTLENMRFSKAIVDRVNPEGKVAFSTTNYHVFRSGLSARRVKMRAVGMGAETKWYYWPNAAVREFIGLLTNHRGKQALILGSMIVFYLVLTFLTYQ